VRKHTHVLVAASFAAVLAGSAAGCSSSGHASDSARAAASSLAANPTYQQDKQRLEAELLANFKKHFNPAHPITSMEAAVQATFPGGSSTKIVNYAVQTFKLSDAKPGAKRQAWIQGVVAFALNQDAQGVPSGAASVPIPGVTASVPTPSATPSATPFSSSPASTTSVASSTLVIPGSFCSVAGATGISKSGHAEVCRSSSTDSHLRWRRP